MKYAKLSCKNCGGKMNHSSESHIIICEYCDSELDLRKQEGALNKDQISKIIDSERDLIKLNQATIDRMKLIELGEELSAEEAKASIIYEIIDSNHHKQRIKMIKQNENSIIKNYGNGMLSALREFSDLKLEISKLTGLTPYLETFCIALILIPLNIIVGVIIAGLFFVYIKVKANSAKKRYDYLWYYIHDHFTEIENLKNDINYFKEKTKLK